MTVLQLTLFALAAWTGGVGCYALVSMILKRVPWIVVALVAGATLLLGVYVLSQLLGNG